jgi:anti-sigma factor RsiW
MTMGRRVWLWRWRRNPLRRRSYLVEGWVFPAIGLAAAVAASFTGTAVTHGMEHLLAQQRVDRHVTAAVLAQDASDVAGYVAEPRARVRWTAPDGTTRTGITKVGLDLHRGARVMIWTDRRGQLVPAPLSSSDARLEAVLTGIAAGGGVGGAVLAGLAVATRLADRRRAEEWAAEWAVTGPRWDSHKT